MRVYQAGIRAGKVKVLSAEVVADAGTQWEVDRRNEISPCFIKLNKSSVFQSPEEAVEALGIRLRKSIEHATSEIKSDLRDLERCHAWKLDQCTASKRNE